MYGRLAHVCLYEPQRARGQTTRNEKQQQKGQAINFFGGAPPARPRAAILTARARVGVVRTNYILNFIHNNL